MIRGRVAPASDDPGEQAEDFGGALAEAIRLAESGALAEAEPRLRALAARDGLSARDLGRALLEHGWALGAMMRLDEAARTLARAAEVARRGEALDLARDAFVEGATVARYGGRLADAERLANEARVCADELGDLAGRARALFLCGTIHHQRGDYLGGRALLDEALTTLDAATVPGGSPTPATGAEADGAAEDRIGVANDRRLDVLRADILRELGASARMAGDFAETRRHLERAGELYRQHGRLTGEANVIRELGALAVVVGDPDQARRHYWEAHERYERVGRRMGTAAVLRRLGMLELETAHHAESERLLRLARDAFEGEPRGLGSVALYLAMLARLGERFDDATAELAEAERVFARTGDASGLAHVAIERAQLARAFGRHDDAVGLLELAITTLTQAGNPHDEAKARYELSRQFMIMGRPHDALAHSVRDVEIRERFGYLLPDPAERFGVRRYNRDSYLQAIHVAVLAREGWTALRVGLAGRAEALASSLRDGQWRLAPRLRDQLGEIRLLQASVVSATGDDDTSGDGTADGPGGRARPRARLAEAFKRLEQQTSATMRTALDRTPTDPAELQRALPPDGHVLLLDTDDDDPRICWQIWLPARGEPGVEDTMLSAEAVELLAAYQRREPDAGWTEQTDLLCELGAHLLPRGLVEALRASPQPPRLVVVTGSALATFPFAALEVDGLALAELAEPVWNPSLATWAALARRPARAGRGVLAYYDRVPGATRERRALETALGLPERLEARSIPAKLRAAGGYQALVLAAHGDDNAGLAHALRLGDGQSLTAADLLDCDLPDLVVMGSCWSGRLRVRVGEEPLGLPTAALLAGARCVIAGVVDVGGTSTASVLTEFYRRIAQGTPPARALRDAQVGYRRTHPGAAPAQWAGHVAVGYSPPAVDDRHHHDPVDGPTVPQGV